MRAISFFLLMFVFGTTVALVLEKTGVATIPIPAILEHLGVNRLL
jgi:hypothetical protein